MNKKIIYAFVFLLTGFMFACTPEDIYDESYDIRFSVARITGFSPDTAIIGQEIEITGENLNDTSLQVFIGSEAMTIVPNSISANKVKVIVPRTAVTSKIKVITAFSGDANVNQFSFKPLAVKYPKTEFTSLPDTIFLTQPYIAKGNNMDLITKVAIDTLILTYNNANPNEAKFDFKALTIDKPVVSLNFVTKNKDNFADKQVVVMQDLPKIKIVAQFPDPAQEGELLTLVFDRPEFGKFITSASVEYANDTTVKKPKLVNFAVTDLKVDVNKISFTLPDTGFLDNVGPNAVLTGVIRINGLYKLAVKHQIMLQ